MNKNIAQLRPATGRHLETARPQPAHQHLLATLVVLVGLGDDGLLVQPPRFRPALRQTGRRRSLQGHRRPGRGQGPLPNQPRRRRHLVPADKVYQVRMQMAGKGIPRGEGVGFEIFDKANFGISDFVQRANYTRAVQGELARTISQLTRSNPPGS